MREHHCHIGGCNVPTRPVMLFCRKHWAMVPKEMQAEVYRHYKNGQCTGGKISRKWIKAAMAARLHVEGIVRQQEKSDD